MIAEFADDDGTDHGNVLRGLRAGQDPDKFLAEPCRDAAPWEAIGCSVALAQAVRATVAEDHRTTADRVEQKRKTL